MYILDHQGAIAWVKPNTNNSNFRMHENGTMSYFAHGQFFFTNGEFEVYDSISCVDGAVTDAHELIWNHDNGHYYLIGIRTDTMDCTNIALPENCVWEGATNTAVKYGVIQELDENKQLVWEWNSKGKFNSEDIDPVYLTDDHKLDLPHFNAIDVDASGNLLLTARFTNEVVYLNRSTGEIEWRFGGNRSDFTLVNDSIPFLGQHAAHFLGNGNILLYDNGYTYGGNVHNARAIEYKLDLQAKTATHVWSWDYPGMLVTESTGNAQRLSDGRTLMSFGKILNRTPNVLFAVIGANNKMEMQCSLPDTAGTYRTYYYPNLNFTFERPITVNFWDRNYLSLATEDSSVVMWSNGLVSNGIQLKEPGTYQYFIENGDGSYTGSEPFVLTEEMIAFMEAEME